MDWQRIQIQAFWVIFTVTFLGIAVWESKAPQRAWTLPTGQRWTRHGLLFLLNATTRSLLLRTTPLAVALLVEGSAWGLVGRMPLWLGVPATIIVFDLSKFFAHRLYHAVPCLWRMHRVHHSDPDYDIATGLRFHPLETMFGQVVDIACVVALAPPVAGVVVAGLLATLFTNLQHANADFPPAWERALRPWILTPASHRTHHSARMADQLSNFGELVPWWDQLGGTYRARPGGGEQNLQVGLEGYRDEASNGVLALLKQPFEQDQQPVSPSIPAGADRVRG